MEDTKNRETAEEVQRGTKIHRVMENIGIVPKTTNEAGPSTSSPRRTHPE